MENSFNVVIIVNVLLKYMVQSISVAKGDNNKGRLISLSIQCINIKVLVNLWIYFFDIIKPRIQKYYAID